jgi:hypothetical protein
MVRKEGYTSGDVLLDLVESGLDSTGGLLRRGSSTLALEQLTELHGQAHV